MEIRYAVAGDAAFLADINRQLIEDEWGGGGMSLERLEARMLRWIGDDEYRAVLFQEADATVAYALVSLDEDSAFIRHFYVLREHRGKGVGTRAIETLFAEVIPAGFRTTLDVLASNQGGHQFWRSQGFADYAVRMERLPRDGNADGH
ncbi:MAG TPA: GNAT family N-acetyltransferase [Longimicrobium sp.]|nr:GNAT family N-acetyltransferase [Longimicrobium sp.]